MNAMDPMNATLRLVVSESAEPEPATFLLRGQELVVGRDEDVDVVVVEPSVSGRHGRLAPAGAGYVYTDLGSTNGSALMRAGGVAEVCAPGVPAMLGPGDVLLLGDRVRAVTMRVEAVAAPVGAGAVAAVSGRTVVARAPLADLFGVGRKAGDTASLASLAARVMTVPSAGALAEEALAFLGALTPSAAQRGVALWGPGVMARAGEAVPSGLAEAAMAGGGLEQAEVLSEGSATPLPETASLVSAGTRAALVVPLMTRVGAGDGGSARGLSWGILYAASPLGAAAFAGPVLEHAAIAGALVALGAAELARRVEREARAAALAEENARLQVERAAAAVPIGRAKAFVEVVKMAGQVAAADVPLLITGETGSGKEVLARYVHRASRRDKGPFVAFNCAAIPENLIESELFGFVKGAFTGAAGDRKGLFEEAHGGTLFLDEIGEMPPLMQAKLLRVLQDGEVRRVGANKPVHVDVRVISATHRDLAALVGEGRFRADLMYRLNAVTLKLPPLREREDDVALLAHVFLSRAAAQCRKSFPGFSPDALWALTTYRFPGNIRELDNEILRAAALTPDGEPIAAAVFSEALRQSAPAALSIPADGVVPLKDAVARAERVAIERALEHAAGNVAEAARLLGVTRPGLYKAMERLGLR